MRMKRKDGKRSLTFDITLNVEVEHDKSGIVRSLRHLQEPYTGAETPQALSAQYVHDVAGIYNIDERLLMDLSKPISKEITDEETLIRLAETNSIMETFVVSYSETHFGLQIWEAGISVIMHDHPLRVTSSNSTIHYNVTVRKPDPNARYMPDRIDIRSLEMLLGINTQGSKSRIKQINGTRLLIYKYDSNLRFEVETAKETQKEINLLSGPTILPLPPVPPEISDGMHYVVAEVLFPLVLENWGEVNWRTFLEVETGAVLYLRPAVASCNASIYQTDPNTSTGDITIRPNSPNTTLDPLRTTTTLARLTTSTPQSLNGQFVQILDTDPPNVAPPTSPTSPCNFADSVPSDTFAAANTYYHLDTLYGLVQGMGFTVSGYFSNTTFPVSADHRGKNNLVNASADGNATFTALSRFQFGRAQSGSTVGIAVDKRIVTHEFGHHCLYDHVRSPNFGFAHSCGDSIAVILSDPDSHLSGPDRYLSFPFIPLISDSSQPSYYRRHDRPVAGGWGWGGTHDTWGDMLGLGYSQEQILSTTLFRIYNSMGGDSANSNLSQRIAAKRFAARYLVYLIFRAIGTLGPSPVTPTPSANVFVNALMNSDLGLFERQPGGAFQKVIRWGFEKQGLYRAPGAPATSEGAAPAVDVYINDGRNGEYQYQEVFWNNTDIWNRNHADGVESHEPPVVGVTNYAYVWVRNRGTQAANNIIVRGYHCRPSTGLVWPDDWQGMTTEEISVPGAIPPGGVVKVGPFQWTPTTPGHECILMYCSAPGDLSNIDPAATFPCAVGPTPHAHLVPFDNNIGQRNVVPVMGGRGAAGLTASLKDRRFSANNPFKDVARIVLEPIIPDFLSQRNWKIVFLNPGGASFTLGPRASREIIFTMKQGDDFSPADVEAAGDKAVIEIRSLIDDILVGGMTYVIDPKLKSLPPE